MMHCPSFTPNLFYLDHGAAANDLYYRQQALRFLQISLASVLNLRGIEDGSPYMPPAPPAAPPSTSTDKQAASAAAPAPGSASVAHVAQPPAPMVSPSLEAALSARARRGNVAHDLSFFADSLCLHVQLEQGVKTKTQLVAERSVLVTLLAAVIGASADEKLAPIAAPFSRDICRHFGMLFASNKEPPPPPPAMFRHQQDSFHAAMPQGLRELDYRLFLDAIVEVLGDKGQQPMEGVEVPDSAGSGVKRAGESSGSGSGSTRHGKASPAVGGARPFWSYTSNCHNTHISCAADEPCYGWRALLWVVRGLPDHCVAEAAQLDASLAMLLRKALLGEQPAPSKAQEQNRDAGADERDKKQNEEGDGEKQAKEAPGVGKMKESKRGDAQGAGEGKEEREKAGRDQQAEPATMEEDAKQGQPGPGAHCSNLTASNEDIWMAAKAGVSTLLRAHNKVAKNTLHTGLRPLLTSFKSHWQLTLPILQGMARLLEMLSEWFSNTLGKRLLEHLCVWMSPEGPCGKGGNCAWRPGEEAAVAAHLMELFHLLPRQAAVFLETHEDEEKVEVEVDGKKETRRVVKNRLGLVVLTIELEERLANLRLMVPAPRVMTSPYRQPLTHFLNK
ncbi:hypothetical protein DUNSADRAFT_13397 [Dunaliella salina]|uniref:Uncharacterized protein n=1 Tax=Dunaliella salina TaxID=3046 RepID=A0ABQ7H3C9_DUNSA|nr:hypothetical protein DUNSADRAFT_13397 [Dunaliella salina]|eukprot:KAF5841321.1 hypothetical protein DUNSADRAFT_13397 [Dunaliella salina]